MNGPLPPARDARFTAPSPPREGEWYDGVLPVDKPAGPTSHDIVAAVRRHFRIPKVGHGGTLDPQATGLLVILLGRGTKLSDRLMSGDKTYEGSLRLGQATSTQDAEGEVTRTGDASGVTAEDLGGAMRRQVGDLLQTPPMVSAVKIDGVPLYKRARKGQEVERQPRLVHVYRFDLTAFDPPDAAFTVCCTKGTYVRTLCHDIGEALGCGAHLRTLRRTQSGRLTLEGAVGFEALLGMEADDLRRHILPLSQFRAV